MRIGCIPWLGSSSRGDTVTVPEISFQPSTRPSDAQSTRDDQLAQLSFQAQIPPALVAVQLRARDGRTDLPAGRGPPGASWRSSWGRPCAHRQLEPRRTATWRARSARGLGDSTPQSTGAPAPAPAPNKRASLRWKDELLWSAMEACSSESVVPAGGKAGGAQGWQSLSSSMMHRLPSPTQKTRGAALDHPRMSCGP